jgi:glycine cleavage system aminomethyltransferase T
MYFPLYYEDPVSEYWAPVNDIIVWDVARERQVEITGPDAFRFVQRLTPRNLTQFPVGECKYIFLTAEDGGIINDPVLLRLGENRFWLSAADLDVLLWAKGVALDSGMEVTILEPDVSPLAVQGPKALDVIAKLLGEWIKATRYFCFGETDLKGIPFVLARSGWSKQDGFELYLQDSRYGDELWELIMEAGGPFGNVPGAPSGIERVESGLLNYGSDMTLENNPYEIGMGKFVDLDQEVNFIGKDALRRIRSEGIKQKLVGVEWNGQPLPSNEESWPVRADGQPAGKLTSCVYSPRLDRNIGYAMVPVEYASNGAQLTVRSPTKDVTATVRPFPFLPDTAADQENG